MAATAGTIFAVGRSGKPYATDVYIPDAVATVLTFNPSGLAASTSLGYWVTPEPVIITDIVSAGVPAAVGVIAQVNGATLAGSAVRWANLVNTVVTRKGLNIPVPGNVQLGFLQF